MNLEDVRNILNNMLNDNSSEYRDRNIVFWYDLEKEFLDDIDELKLTNARTIKLYDNNCFYIKYLIEKEDTKSNFLIYSSIGKPTNRENWLLDILNYSMEFSTDKTSLVMRDLKVKDETLRPILKKYAKFFNNKERYKKFRSFSFERYTEESINLGVLATLCKVVEPKLDFEDVLRNIFIEGLNGENKYINSINKYGDIESFWKLCNKKYGYYSDEKSLKMLWTVFLITNIDYNLKNNLPKSWKEHVSSKNADVIVFMSNFMNNRNYSKYYEELSFQFENELKIKEYLKNWSIDDYIKCDNFKIFDEVIIDNVKNNLIDDIGEFEKYRRYINDRRTTHWFSYFENDYEVVYSSLEFFRVIHELNGNIKQEGAYEIFNKYTKFYYLVDLHYRKFYTAFDEVREKEKYASLVNKVENIYVNLYLNELSNTWSKSVEDCLTEYLPIDGVDQQKDFYRKYLSDYVHKKERVFVIISDGFRYESAKEFCEILNTERKGAVEISYMQGSLPSYTKLGMASLLPNKMIEMNDSTEVIVDGVNSAVIENREKILGMYSKNASAITYKILKDMNRNDYKKFFEGKKLVYIYHDEIDAFGDNHNTEDKVFSAVKTTFEELTDIIKNLVNNISASNIFVTADHGFIYRRSELNEFDKLERKLESDCLEKKKRFVITKHNENIDKTLNFNMNYILKKQKDINVIVPRGVNYFKTSGSGIKYLHGGISLQEIVVPVIKFKNIRSKSDKFDIKKVTVKITSINRKITNRISYIEFFQVEKVEDKYVPLRLKVYFIDENNNKISNENIVIADSRSTLPEERTFREKFTLRDIKYDKNLKYYLIMEDEDEKSKKYITKLHLQ